MTTKLNVIIFTVLCFAPLGCSAWLEFGSMPCEPYDSIGSDHYTEPRIDHRQPPRTTTQPTAPAAKPTKTEKPTKKEKKHK